MGCPHPPVGDRGQLLLTSGRALSWRHASPRSGVPAGRGAVTESLGVKTSARRVTPEVPSTPEKTGVILNELPASAEGSSCLLPSVAMDTPRKLPWFHTSVSISVNKSVAAIPRSVFSPGTWPPRAAASGALPSSLNRGRPGEPVCTGGRALTQECAWSPGLYRDSLGGKVRGGPPARYCLLPAGSVIPETLLALDERVDKNTQQ